MSDDPEITTRILAAAERLARIEFTEAERELGLRLLPLPPLTSARRRAVELPNATGPATGFDPRLPGTLSESGAGTCVASKLEAGGLPDGDDEIAFASLGRLSLELESQLGLELRPPLTGAGS